MVSFQMRKTKPAEVAGRGGGDGDGGGDGGGDGALGGFILARDREGRVDHRQAKAEPIIAPLGGFSLHDADHRPKLNRAAGE
jgi:hypothetical protein